MLSFIMAATRAFPRWVPCLLALLPACATSQSTAPPIDPAPSPFPPIETTTAMPAAASAQPESPSQGRSDAKNLNGTEGLTQLCEFLRDEASLTFPGNAVEQARAYEAHAQRRESLIGSRYTISVPATGYNFRTYELGERRLILDTEHGLMLGDGAGLLISSKTPAPAFPLGPDLADHILGLRSAGKVVLRLVFEPASSELRKNACLWLSGGRVVKLEIDVVAAALVASDGTILTRAEGGDYSDGSMVMPVRSPTVVLQKPRTADGKDLPANLIKALEVLAHRSKPCYERVLLVRPGLRGTIVLGVRIGSGGRVESPRIEMSSLGDDAVTNCVSRAAAKTTITGATPGQRLSVPLHFRSAEE